MFYRVLYFSIHRYENGQFWPNLRESDWDCTGNGDGQGFNINVPLNATGMRDTDYLAIFHQVLLPVASEVCNINNYFYFIMLLQKILFILVSAQSYFNIVWL